VTPKGEGVLKDCAVRVACRSPTCMCSMQHADQLQQAQ
jgi:hypothetical protein